MAVKPGFERTPCRRAGPPRFRATQSTGSMILVPQGATLAFAA
jgi:hypothetical protein